MRATAITALVTILALAPAGSAVADILIEDFEDPGGGGAFDPAFNHVLHDVGDPNSPGFWELDGEVLWLYPATDEVTFNLGPGEYVDWAEVTLADFCGVGCTSVEFIGTAGSMLFENVSVSAEETYNTTGLGLGEITGVVLTSYEGRFDNLTINVVPEPATAVLLTLTSALRRRRGPRFFPPVAPVSNR